MVITTVGGPPIYSCLQPQGQCPQARSALAWAYVGLGFLTRPGRAYSWHFWGGWNHNKIRVAKIWALGAPTSADMGCGWVDFQRKGNMQKSGVFWSFWKELRLASATNLAPRKAMGGLSKILDPSHNKKYKGACRQSKSSSKNAKLSLIKGRRWAFQSAAKWR